MTPIELAEAIKTQLEAATFSLAPNSVERAYVPTIELKDLRQLKLLVVPREHVREINDETAWDRETTIDIGVLFKFPGGNSREIPNADIDPYSALATEILEHFSSDGYQPPDSGMEVVSVKHDPIFMPDHLTSNRQFTSVVSVSFGQVM